MFDWALPGSIPTGSSCPGSYQATALTHHLQPENSLEVSGLSLGPSAQVLHAKHMCCLPTVYNQDAFSWTEGIPIP